MPPFIHWIAFAVFYSCLGFCLTLGLARRDIIYVTFAFSLIFSTIQLSSIWSALGTGKFINRFLSSLAVASIVFGGIGFGLMVVISTKGLAYVQFRYALEFFFSVPTLVFAAQLPFWFFRGAFGWRIVFEESKPAPPISLKELFGVTFVVALTFAAMQLSIDSLSAVEGVAIETNAVPLSPEEAETAIKSQRSEMRTKLMMGQLALSLAFFVGSCLSTPFVFLIFRGKNWKIGSLYCAGLVLTIIVIATVISSLAFGTMMGMGVIALIIAVFVLNILGVLGPLAFTRSVGYSLTTSKLDASETNVDNSRNA